MLPNKVGGKNPIDFGHDRVIGYWWIIDKFVPEM